VPDIDHWVRNPAPRKLTGGEVHVWRANLHCEEAALHRFAATLASDEMARANRFYFQRDRNSHIAARGILRELLGQYLNRSPSELVFDYGSFGKPSLRPDTPEPFVQFNVSHSHGLALLAFATGRQLGVDVERIRPDIAAEEIAERYFSPIEVAELNALPPSLRAEGFFLCWTRKEAYVKARGEGLQIPLKSFHVSVTPSHLERLHSADSNRWSLHSLRPSPDSVGAVVAEGQNSHLLCYDWSHSTIA
jgi:4'-phosphopantetheinyl transferase